MGVRNILTGAGAVVGSFFGQPQLGLAIGSLIGNIVDPQRIKGPALKEFPVLGVTEGAYRQVAYGTTIIRDCQLIDWGPLDPVIVEEQQGKGGGPVVESQRLYQTYAVAIGEPIEAVRYIKRDGVMVYDLRPGSAILPESADFAGRLRIYLGDEAQLPDPDLEALALNGVGNTPSYRGTSYFVVVRDDLTDLGGRIPTYEVEVVTQASLYSVAPILITNSVSFLGAPDALSAGPSFNQPSGSGAFTLRASPDGEYVAFGSEGDTGSGRFGWRKWNAGTNTWDSLTNPADMPAIGPYGMKWSNDGNYLACGFFTASPNNLFVYARSGDTLTKVAQSVLPNLSGYDVAWSSDDSMLSIGNAVTNRGMYVFDIAAGVLSNARFNTDNIGAGLQTAFSPDGAFIAAVTRDAGLHVYSVGAGSLTLIDSIGPAATPVGWSGCHWNADGIITVADSGAPGYDFVKTWLFDGTNLTAAGAPATQPPTLPRDSALSSDGRYLVTVDSTSNLHVYDLSNFASPALLEDQTAASETVTWAQAVSVEIDGAPATLAQIVADIADRCGIPAAKLDLSELTDEVKGLTLGGQYDGAGAITTLMPPYFFDLYEADKEVRAPKRGGAVKATITEADLVEDIDENSLRGQDIEYPRKLQLKYLNPAQNYAAPAAVFARTTPDVRVRGEANMDLPICFDETQALQVAERILKVMWEDLNGEVTLSLPAGPFAWLAPTDCLGLSIRGALFRIRVEKVEDVDGVLKVTARRDRQSAYTSVLTAIPLPPPAGPPPSLAGVTQFVLLNAPGVIDSDDQLGVRIGVCGLPGTAWSGATVRYSTDAGETWTTAATLRTAARLGTLTAALPAALAGYTDATNPLQVTLIGDRQLEAVTDLQLLQEGNGAAIAYPDGTCELLQFRDVVDNGARAWTLRHLPRGGLATEADLHAIGAKFVMLDGTTFVPLPSALIGSTLRFQFVSLGTSPETAPIFDMVWNPAVAQTEFPPASLALTRGSGVISATWAPRHRFGIDTIPVASVNFTGFRVTLTDGTVTQVYDQLAPSYSGADTAFTGPITVTVQQLNRFTGAGPGTSGII